MASSIKHELASGTLIVHVTIGENISASVTYECHKSGGLYKVAYSAMDIAQLHRIFIGMPELFATYIRANIPTITTRIGGAIVAHFNAMNGEHPIRFDIVMIKDSANYSASDVVEIQQQLRLATRKLTEFGTQISKFDSRLTAIESRLAGIDAKFQTLNQSISTLAKLTYPYALETDKKEVDELDQMIIGFDINTIVGDIFICKGSYNPLKRLVEKGLNTFNIRIRRNDLLIPLLFDMIDQPRPNWTVEQIREFVDMFKYFVNHGCNVNAEYQGVTVLHYIKISAAMNPLKVVNEFELTSPHKHMITILIAAGAIERPLVRLKTLEWE
jgi:hypothetical protein